MKYHQWITTTCHYGISGGRNHAENNKYSNEYIVIYLQADKQ